MSRLDIALQVVATLLAISGLGWLIAAALHKDAYYAALAATMFAIATYTKT